MAPLLPLPLEQSGKPLSLSEIRLNVQSPYDYNILRNLVILLSVGIRTIRLDCVLVILNSIELHFEHIKSSR